MGELLLGISAGLVVSMINKYILPGTLWTWCRHKREDEDDDCDDDGLDLKDEASIDPLPTCYISMSILSVKVMLLAFSYVEPASLSVFSLKALRPG